MGSLFDEPVDGATNVSIKKGRHSGAGKAIQVVPGCTPFVDLASLSKEDTLQLNQFGILCTVKDYKDWFIPALFAIDRKIQFLTPASLS